MKTHTWSPSVRRLPCVSAVLLFAVLVIADGQEPSSPKLNGEPSIKRLKPKEPQDAAKTFSVLHGFRMELIAHEPLLRDPVSITYDENGAMYVVEMTAYPHPHRSNEQALGQVRLLLDDDHDGNFDSSYVFADKLSTPTSAICWKGGVFVIAPPDLWYLKDTDGDHKADIRKQVFTGFGINNAETLANNLKWGIDNKIYGAASHSGGSIRPADDPSAKPISISGRDFCFDPQTSEFETLSWATSRWGNSFDDAYNRFVCQNTGPARHVVLPRRYLARNPYLRVESVYQSLAKEVGTEPVYRTSPPEPWRVVRAFRRQALGKPANPGEINAAGYFTASCGITIYRGHAWPEQFRGNIFVGDAAGNLVHRRTVTPSGVTFDSQRADDGAEFIASSDNFFRPVNFVNAPDGTLHVVDMYREVVEGPSWVPEDLKKKGLVDVHGGSDRGRVYRIAPPGFQVPPPPQLGKARTAELVKHLENPNSWWRETAQRLLVERQDKSAVEPLRRMLAAGKVPTGRLHALWILEGLGGLRNEDLIVALSDRSAVLREHAVRAAEPRLNTSSRLLEKVIPLHSDDASRVRFQVAFTLGEVDDTRAVEALANIAVRDQHDPWIRTAVLSSSYKRLDQLLRALLVVPAFAKGDGVEMLKEIAFMLGSRNEPAEIKRALSSVARLKQPASRSLTLQIQLVAQFLGTDQQKLVVSSAGELVDLLMPHVRGMASDEGTAAALRADAIAFLVFDKFERAKEVLKPLIDTHQPREVQMAAIRLLSHSSDKDVAALLIEKWNNTTPQVRSEIVETLASKNPWVSLLLAAVKEKQIPAGEISAARRAQLLKHPNAAIRKQAALLLADEVLGERNDVIAAYQPALAITGDAERGKAIFLRECTACHRFGNQGHDIGPNLSDYGRKRLPPASLMAQILDPNREVSSEFVNYVVVLNNGKIVSGIIASQTPGSITVQREKNDTVTILRKDIEAIKSSGKSLMPEGLEKNIDHQQMADLLQFLMKINERI
ncbi:MAG: HEAT repeat domain-containing protein [Planctomycetes bacterium]|nr:HEAT repeat domain-containing protein [Planctomycetota bacterium]